MGGEAHEPRGRAPRVDATRLVLVILVGAALWFVPVPAGVQPRAWQLLAVFVATMVGIVVRPMPMGAMAFRCSGLRGALRHIDDRGGYRRFSGVPWCGLVVAAFFIATAFVKTGLGTRIAYHFMRLLGKRSLGLAYGFLATDLVLAPAIPSNTARAGGVIFSRSSSPSAFSLDSGRRARHPAPNRRFSDLHRLPGRRHHERDVS